MLLICPSCETRYEIPPDAIGAEGKMVRCARCGHDWHEGRGDDARAPVIAVEEAEIEPPPKLRPPKRPPPRARARTGGTNWAGWAALVVIVGALGAGAVIARERVVALWPPAAKLYALARLPIEAAGTGLERRNLRWSQEDENGVMVLLVEGEIVNISNTVRKVPKIRVTLRDEAGVELGHWLVPAPRDRLRPGEMVRYSTRREKPPAQARELSVSFDSGG